MFKKQPSFFINNNPYSRNSVAGSLKEDKLIVKCSLETLLESIKASREVRKFFIYFLYFCLSVAITACLGNYNMGQFTGLVHGSLKDFGGPITGNIVDLDQAETIYDVAEYSLNWLNYTINESIEKDGGAENEGKFDVDGNIVIGEHAIAGTIFAAVDYKTNCKFKDVECADDYPSDEQPDFTHWPNISFDAMQGFLASEQYVALLKSPNITRAETMDWINHLMGNSLVDIDRFAFSYYLGVVVYDEISHNQGLFFIFVSRFNILDSFIGINTPAVDVKTITLVSHSEMFSKNEDIFRLICEVLFLFASMRIFGSFIDEWYLAFCQRGGAFLWTMRDCLNWRTVWEILGTIFALSYFGIYVFWVIPTSLKYSDGIFPDTPQACMELQEMAFAKTGMYYIMIEIMMIAGIRSVFYLRYQPGLRVFVLLLGRAWKYLREFIIFVFIILTILALALTSLFQGTSGSEDFRTESQSYFSLLRLTFGFYEYDGFIEGAEGYLGSEFQINVVFLILLAILIAIIQNVLLAIVASTYDEIQFELEEKKKGVHQLLDIKDDNICGSVDDLIGGNQIAEKNPYATYILTSSFFSWVCRRLLYVMKMTWNSLVIKILTLKDSKYRSDPYTRRSFSTIEGANDNINDRGKMELDPMELFWAVIENSLGAKALYYFFYDFADDDIKFTSFWHQNDLDQYGLGTQKNDLTWWDNFKRSGPINHESANNQVWRSNELLTLSSLSELLKFIQGSPTFSAVSRDVADHRNRFIGFLFNRRKVTISYNPKLTSISLLNFEQADPLALRKSVRVNVRVRDESVSRSNPLSSPRLLKSRKTNDHNNVETSNNSDIELTNLTGESKNSSEDILLENRGRPSLLEKVEEDDEENGEDAMRRTSIFGARRRRSSTGQAGYQQKLELNLLQMNDRLTNVENSITEILNILKSK